LGLTLREARKTLHGVSNFPLAGASVTRGGSLGLTLQEVRKTLHGVSNFPLAGASVTRGEQCSSRGKKMNKHFYEGE